MTRLLPSDALYALRELQLNSKEAPSEFPLLITGTWRGYIQGDERREFTVTRSDLEAAYELHKLRKARNPQRDLVLDFEHQTITGGIAPAAGWFDLELRGDVLYATNVRWTSEAKAMVESGKYRYVSPVFKHNALDKVTGRTYRMAVMNAALTNEPFLDELPPLIMKGSDIKLFSFSYIAQLKELGIALKDDMSLTLNDLFEAVKTRIESLNREIALKDSVIAMSLRNHSPITTTERHTMNTALTDAEVKIAKALGTDLALLAKQKEADALVTEAKQQRKISPATADTWLKFALSDMVACKAQLEKIPAGSAPAF